MDVFQRDLWGCVEPGGGQEGGQRGVNSPTGPAGPAPSVPRQRSQGGTEPSRHVSGLPWGRSPRSREDAGGEPAVTGRRGGRLPSALSFMCDRSFADSPSQLADLSAVVPTGELFWGVCAHGAAGREGARPLGKALCCQSERRAIKLRLLRAASSVPGCGAFEVGLRIFLLNE